MLAGLLWRAWPRTSARTAVALSVVVALASGITAQAVAPRDRWFELPGSHGQARPSFRLLDTEPTFEPLPQRPNGAPMLDIRASEPALWRMQTLDVFDGRGWRASPQEPRLPEPAAQPVRVDVRVRGLRNDLVASPGAVERIDAAGTAEAGSGSARRLVPGPQAGDTYRVHARVVHARAGELRGAPPPRDPRAAAYTHLGWDRGRYGRASRVVQIGRVRIPVPSPRFGNTEPPSFPVDVPLFGQPPDAAATAALDRSPYRGVAELARRLASGARTEWQVVDRVMHYLTDDNRFRYTTDPRPPGHFPLADFLLRTHAGYCQHFAGGAALLLRMAGVPARVVAGFATGVRRRGHFEVRDVDAHDWIEVYFAGYGWVPFNPTPAAAPAAIPPQLDLLADTAGRGRMPGSRLYVILGVLAAAALAGGRIRRRPQLSDALARLLGTPLPPSTTLGELRDQLARALGPRTAALAAEAERARFACDGAGSRRWTSARIARALAHDVGPSRAALLLVLPTAVRPRVAGRPTPGAAVAGARSSQQDAPGDLA